MDERYFLENAQEAEAFADAAFSDVLRCHWEYIAAQYRRLAQQAAKTRRCDQRPQDTAHS